MIIEKEAKAHSAKGVKNRWSNRNQGYGPRTSSPRETSARRTADIIRIPSGERPGADAVYELSVCASCGRVSGWADYD